LHKKELGLHSNTRKRRLVHYW